MTMNQSLLRNVPDDAGSNHTQGVTVLALSVVDHRSQLPEISSAADCQVRRISGKGQADGKEEIRGQFHQRGGLPKLKVHNATLCITRRGGRFDARFSTLEKKSHYEVFSARLTLWVRITFKKGCPASDGVNLAEENAK